MWVNYKTENVWFEILQDTVCITLCPRNFLFRIKHILTKDTLINSALDSVLMLLLFCKGSYTKIPSYTYTTRHPKSLQVCFCVYIINHKHT